MKKIKLFLSIFIALLVSCFCVLASDDAPPAIPSEFYGTATVNGAAAGDGLAVTGEVGGVNYAQSSQTLNGYYNIILVDGDRELTYIGDNTCATHWAADEACVPCSTTPTDPDYCIEGPEDGDLIKIKVDNSAIPADDGTMPYTEWERGSNTELALVTPIGDWGKTGCVSTADIPFFADHYEETCSDPGWDPIYDLNWDCMISTADIPVFADHYEEGC